MRNVKSLDLAADALAKGEAIPEEAVKLMARPLVPRWLYLLIGNRGWVRGAKSMDARSGSTAGYIGIEPTPGSREVETQREHAT